MDKYQSRYQDHQKIKAEVLSQIMQERHSDRIFNGDVTPEELGQLLTVIDDCPSSCDRKAIKATLITDRDDKALLSGLLVGGVGWAHRAPAVFLLFADKTAYKEGLFYMPYLDAGVVIGNLYLKTTSLGLRGCYVNPNIREQNKLRKDFYINYFAKGNQNLIPCGAFAVGR